MTRQAPPHSETNYWINGKASEPLAENSQTMLPTSCYWPLSSSTSRFWPIQFSLTQSVIFLFFYLQIAVPIVASQSLSDAPLLQAYFTAYEKKDTAAMAQLWTHESPDYQAFQRKLEQLFATADKINVKQLRLLKTQTGPTEAWYWLEVEILGNDLKTGLPLAGLGKQKLALQYRRISGEWKVWRSLSAFDRLATLLLSATTAEERQALLKLYPEFFTMDLAVTINERGRTIFRAPSPDYPAALQAFRLAYELGMQLREYYRASGWLTGAAITLQRMGRTDEAIHECEKGLEAFTALGAREATIPILNRLGKIHTDLGDYPRASAALVQNLAQLEALGQTTEMSETENLLGNLEYYQGNYDAAFERHKRCLALREELLSKEPKNRDLAYRTAQTHYNLGNLQVERGNYFVALQHFEKSRTLSQMAEQEVEHLLLNFGVVYERQGNFTLAEQFYQQDLEVSRRHNNKPAIAQSLIAIGSFQQAQWEYANAINTLQQALAVSREAQGKELISKSLNLLGGVHAAQRHFTEAMQHYQQSLALREELNDQEGIADTTHNLALVYFEQKEFARAIELATHAATVVSLVGKPELQWRISLTRGNIHAALGQHDKAQAAWQQTIQIIETLRHNLAGEEQQSQSFFETKTAPYLALADSLLAQNQLAQALTYAERAKARTLLDVLQSGKLNLAKAMTAAEQAQERQFNNELVSLNTQLYREQTRETPDQQRLTALSAQVDKARLNYEDFRTRLYAAHPELKVQRGEAQPLTLAEAGALLPDARTALLEFVVLPERVQLFVITKAKTGAAQLQVFSLAVKREELSAKVAQFRQQLADRDQRFGRLARELYTLLLQPARAVLPPQTRLLIVPDGPLWELPFQALQKTNNQYLWAEHVIAYAPSLTVLREMAKLKPAARMGKGKPSFFAIGDPALGGAGVERMKQLMAPVGGTFEQLPEARAQVETVRRFYDPARSRVLTGAAATEAVLKAEAGKYDVLHLATHGVLNDRNPLYSHVLLAQTAGGEPTGAQTEDGLLEAWELMQMDLKAELAVLSACETARGRVGAGEGMIGLTWALFVAGVPTTIVSQWKVRADSTADLMVEFHRQWQTRPAGTWAKAEALRQAALRVQRDTRYQHPFYWAGFVLVGKTQ